MRSREKCIDLMITAVKLANDNLRDIIEDNKEGLNDIVDGLSCNLKLLAAVNDKDNIIKILEAAKIPAKKLDEYYASLNECLDIIIEILE